MKKYEAILILDPRKVDDEGKVFANEVAELIVANGGTVNNTEFMGRKPFVREIKKRKAGYYIDMFFAMPEANIDVIRNKYRLDERMLRLMIVIDDRPANYKAEPIVLN